jgi:cytochrome P450
MDPPAHHGYRAILNPLLTPRVVATFEAQIRELAQSLIEPTRELDSFDLAEMFSAPFPKSVSLRWIGLPDSDRLYLAGLVDATSTTRGEADLADVGLQLATYFGKFVADRRAEPRREDLISKLVDAEIDGRPLADEEIILTLITVLFGALHTTTLTLNGIMLRLLDHPEETQTLLADPSIMSSAVEEFLRWCAPSAGVIRTATKDTSIAGCPIHAGDKVMVLNGSANFDPDEFPEPDRLDLTRQPNRHLTFGSGPHRCVGAHLAKLMLRIGIEEMGPELAGLRLVDRDKVQYAGGEGRGVVSLPVTRVSST